MADRLYAADLNYLGRLRKAALACDKLRLKKHLAIFLAVILASTLSTYSLANEAQNSCHSVPHWEPPFKTGLIAIGTYHVTGEPGSDRLIEATWPRSNLSPFPDVQREDGAEQTLIFYFDSITLDSEERYGTTNLPRIDLVLRGVDKYPLYSRLLGNAGGPIGDLLYHADGHTYRSAEGFEISEQQDLEGWVQYAYPNGRQPSNGRDSWFRGTPDVSGVELLLQCRNNPSGEYQRCSIKGKFEPFFYEAKFDATELHSIDAIDAFVNHFISCMLEES